MNDVERLRGWWQVEMAWAVDVGGGERVEWEDVWDGESDLVDLKEREAETRHDVAAFVSWMQERLEGRGEGRGSELARWVHWGLTSSDVVDTALGMWLKSECDKLLRELWKVQQRDERRLRSVPRLVRARTEVAVGKLSGPVGMGTGGERSGVGRWVDREKRVLRQLGLEPETSPGQVVARDRHVQLLAVLCGLAMEMEAWPELSRLRGWWGAMCESVVLWHERDLSHSSVERVVWAEVWDVMASVVS